VASSETPLSERIREARLSAGLSQVKLAQLLGTTRRTVLKWEAGDNQPGALYGARLEQVLNQPPGTLSPARLGKPTTNGRVSELEEKMETVLREVRELKQLLLVGRAARRAPEQGSSPRR
jgi:transcriptional regulator with XRE-family HTH domain